MIYQRTFYGNRSRRDRHACTPGARGVETDVDILPGRRPSGISFNRAARGIIPLSGRGKKPYLRWPRCKRRNEVTRITSRTALIFQTRIQYNNEGVGDASMQLTNS